MSSKMYPITLNRLLSIADALDCAMLRNLTHDDFNAVCRRAGVGERNRSQCLTAFQHTGFLSHIPGGAEILPRFRRFIRAWNGGDELLMNSALRDYSPYQTFLFDLKHLNHAPPETLEHARGRILQSMAMALGEAYRCPYGTGLYYGGAAVDTADFAEHCNAAYDAATYRTNDSVNFTDLAHEVCLKLSLSLQAFQRHWLALQTTREGETWRIAPATIRRHLQAQLKHCRLVPRQQIQEKRLEAQLLKKTYTPEYLSWFWLQDGIPIGNIQAKLVRKVNKR